MLEKHSKLADLAGIGRRMFLENTKKPLHKTGCEYMWKVSVLFLVKCALPTVHALTPEYIPLLGSQHCTGTCIIYEYMSLCIWTEALRNAS